MATDREVSDAVKNVRETIAAFENDGMDRSDLAEAMLMMLQQEDLSVLLAHLDALTARCEAAEGDAKLMTTYAGHLEWCRYCAEGDCIDGRELRDAAARRGEGV